VSEQQQPSHADIVAHVRDLDRAFEAHKVDAAEFWGEARQANHDVAKTLSVIGTQVERIEEKVLAYDRLRDKILGAITATAVLLGALWWTTKDALAKVFGVTP